MSNDVVITIRLTLPDDARVTVADAPVERPKSVQMPGDEPPFPGFEAPVPIVQEAVRIFSAPTDAPSCPEHGPLHLVPAGTSKKTGRKFRAFWGCVVGCDTRQDAA